MSFYWTQYTNSGSLVYCRVLAGHARTGFHCRHEHRRPARGRCPLPGTGHHGCVQLCRILHLARSRRAASDQGFPPGRVGEGCGVECGSGLRQSAISEGVPELGSAGVSPSGPATGGQVVDCLPTLGTKSGTVSMRAGTGVMVRTGSQAVLETWHHQARIAGEGSGVHVADGAEEVAHTGHRPEAPGHAHVRFQPAEASSTWLCPLWDVRSTAVNAQPVPNVQEVHNQPRLPQESRRDRVCPPFLAGYCSCRQPSCHTRSRSTMRRPRTLGNGSAQRDREIRASQFAPPVPGPSASRAARAFAFRPECRFRLGRPRATESS